MLIMPVFINAVISTLSIGKVLSVAKIYVFSVITLPWGVLMALGSNNYWLLSLSYSLALLVGLIVAIYILEREGITIQARRLFLIPCFILVGTTILGEYITDKLFSFTKVPLCMALTIALLFYLVILFSEYKETIKNFRYIKSKLTA